MLTIFILYELYMYYIFVKWQISKWIWLNIWSDLLVAANYVKGFDMNFNLK